MYTKKWKSALSALLATMIVVASTAFAAAQEKKSAPPAASVDLKITSPEELGEHLQATSVTIRAGGSEGSSTVCRVVNGRTYLTTAAHVVAGLRSTREIIDSKTGTRRMVVEFDDASVILQYRDDEGRTVGDVRWFARVVKYSDAENGEDLALLELRRKGAFDKSASFYLDKNLPPVGTTLYHMGSLLGQFGSNSMTRGIMSQHGRLLYGKIYDQTTVAAFPGSSGGGVYDSKGKYVGMVVRGAGETFNLIVPVRRMKAWTERNGIQWALDHSVPVPSEEELKKLPADDSGYSFSSGERAKDNGKDGKSFRFLIRHIGTDGTGLMEGAITPQDPLILRVIREFRK